MPAGGEHLPVAQPEIPLPTVRGSLRLSPRPDEHLEPLAPGPHRRLLRPADRVDGRLRGRGSLEGLPDGLQRGGRRGLSPRRSDGRPLGRGRRDGRSPQQRQTGEPPKHGVHAPRGGKGLGLRTQPRGPVLEDPPRRAPRVGPGGLRPLGGDTRGRVALAEPEGRRGDPVDGEADPNRPPRPDRLGPGRPDARAVLLALPRRRPGAERRPRHRDADRRRSVRRRRRDPREPDAPRAPRRRHGGPRPARDGVAERIRGLPGSGGADHRDDGPDHDRAGGSRGDLLRRDRRATVPGAGRSRRRRGC
mmetsp:Transcript_7934/g.19730  ORF Transcript_7934/g.19730 Transcript_7934/m.19730 type:complete len:304 (-) Transcript_7934:157-1068(-)